MNGLTRRWLLQEATPSLATDAAGYPPLLQRILAARGLVDTDAIRRFCEPRLTDLCPPDAMPNIDEAAERLVKAVRAGERIAIYGDYDVDGITASAILYHVIRAARPDADLITYVPHRLEEGYGLNGDALRRLRDDGATLAVSVDCGVSAHEPARIARSVGLDLIITDHHNPPHEDDPLPDAIVVHPRLPGSAYPFGDLCGAGVAFKLAWRFATCWCGSERVGASMQRTLMDLLPLVALGTIADVVPLVGENRVLASFGLRLLKQTPLVGLRALITAADLDDATIDSDKVGYVLAPRLNACGRMGHAIDAVRLFTDADETEAKAIAERLTRLNRERQQTERGILEQATDMAAERGMTGPDHRAIVLAHADWHPGVVGIVCSRLVDRFGRPAILLQDKDGVCRGSARSVDGYSIHGALTDVSEHLLEYGGHDMAAGVSLRSDALDAFTRALVDHANRHIATDELVPTLPIDCDTDMAELDVQTVRRMRELSPFGRANRRPTLRMRGVTLAEPPRPLGAHGRHLALRLRDDRSGRRRLMRCIWWGSGELAERLAVGTRIDLAIEPKLNEWKGRVDVEPEIRDVRICD